MPQTNVDTKILLDCDVVIHFLKGGKILELPKIFPNRFVMLDKVKKELLKRDGNYLAINIFLQQTGVPEVPMPTDSVIVREYFTLKRTMDDGEAACLAVAKHKQEFVASSNLRDIAAYCQTHNIVYYTTMDLLHEATLKGIMTDLECDQFITEVRAKGSRMPYNSINDYRIAKGLAK